MACVCFGAAQPDLHAPHAPVHAVSLSALQRGHRISAAEELSPQAGQGVVLGMLSHPQRAREQAADEERESD